MINKVTVDAITITRVKYIVKSYGRIQTIIAPLIKRAGGARARAREGAIHTEERYFFALYGAVRAIAGMLLHARDKRNISGGSELLLIAAEISN